MFTGIIDHYGLITKIDKISQGSRMWVQSNFSELELGESIAVDGICLTVTGINANNFSCDISPETLAVTSAKYFTPGYSVNLERALQLSSRLSGHMVAGHVDQICRVKTIQHLDQFTEIFFTEIDEANMQFILKKGSIAINGVSLTINTVPENTFAVMLIPHTLERTTLSNLAEGDYVNIEFDMVARVIIDQTRRYLMDSIAPKINM